LGLAGARGFGFAVVAARAGVDLVEGTMAVRAEEVVGVAEEDGVLVEVLVEVLDALEEVLGAALAAGAGSGRSLDGELTGGRSGPDPWAPAGALPSPSAATAAPTRSQKKGARAEPPVPRRTSA
jgi:hypothetical protein